MAPSVAERPPSTSSLTVSSATASAMSSASAPLVADDDLQALVEEGHLADPVGDRLQRERGGLEDVGARPERDRGAGLVGRLELLQRPVGYAEAERLAPVVPAVAHVDLQLAAQRVDHRDADAVQTAGDLVAATAELAAGVQHGERHRHGRHVLAGRGVGGDATAVVLDPDAAVGEQGQPDPVAVPGECLVDGVVDDLPDQVVQAALTGGADVHAGTLPHRVEPLEHLDRGGVVLAVLDGVRVAGRGEGCCGLGDRFGGRSGVGRCVPGGGGLVGHKPSFALGRSPAGAGHAETGAGMTKVDPSGVRPRLPIYPPGPDSRHTDPGKRGDPDARMPIPGLAGHQGRDARAAAGSPYGREAGRSPLTGLPDPGHRRPRTTGSVSRRCPADRGRRASSGGPSSSSAGAVRAPRPGSPCRPRAPR